MLCRWRHHPSLTSPPPQRLESHNGSLGTFSALRWKTAVFSVYMFLLFWYAATHDGDVTLPVKSLPENGLSPSELEKLPKVTGKELVIGFECAVCIDEIENDQPARVVPGCKHAFHVECADTWLSRHWQCPICRAKLDPQILNFSEIP